MKKILIVFLSIVAIIALSLSIFTVVDGLFYNERMYYNFIIKENCNYELSNEWELKQDGEFYIVKHTLWDMYLVPGRFDIDLNYSTIEEPLEFKNICIAKGAVKRFLYNNRDRALNFYD